ncbi:Stf0 family sulfotransferase [Sphingomonas sp. ERG5]|uniref:Stf0 family sulfotransferase n=1 Tax=Sphingomonas sp. ERG5 TaxID=1381597 RepID=UPI00054C3285|nr:Stf0 family sulfotransferase [Sphingomonas sp. ERG5]
MTSPSDSTASSDSTTSRPPYDLATADHDYPPWRGRPHNTILICTHPRSGSTLLGEALYFAGGLGCPLEYFHAGFRPGLAARWAAPGIDDYIRAVHGNRTGPDGLLAVKLFWRDVQELAQEVDPARFAVLDGALPEALSPAVYRDLAALLATIFPAPTFVHLHRRDRLRQAISALFASETGKWREIPESGSGKDGIVPRTEPGLDPEFDVERLDRLIGYADFCHGHWRNLFAAIGTAPHDVAYEQLITDYRHIVGGLFAELGSNAEPPAIRMRRQADARSEAFVLRYLRERATRPTDAAR